MNREKYMGMFDELERLLKGKDENVREITDDQEKLDFLKARLAEMKDTSTICSEVSIKALELLKQIKDFTGNSGVQKLLCQNNIKAKKILELMESCTELHSNLDGFITAPAGTTREIREVEDIIHDLQKRILDKSDVQSGEVN
jgi:hypothetical protein